MFDLLLLLLLLARCKTLWHHLFADIINRLNGLQLGCNCRYAVCVAIGVIAPQLLYFLYLFRIMYIIMLYQVKAQLEILQMLMDSLLTICVDHVFCEQNYMDSLFYFYMCDIIYSTNSSIIHVYLVLLLINGG